MSATSLAGIKISEINFNLDRMCRICLSHSTDMNCLFDGNDYKIANKIEFCTGILFKDTKNLPKRICKFCEEKLSIAHTFKTLCLLSVQTFEKILDDIKEETYENQFDNHCDFEDIKIDVQDDNEETIAVCASDKEAVIREPFSSGNMENDKNERKKKSKKRSKQDSIAHKKHREKANARKRKFLNKMTPEQREIKRLKDREYYQRKKAENKVKTVSDMTAKQKRKQRELWRKNSQKYRQKKKMAANILANSPQESENEIENDNGQDNRKVVKRKIRGPYNKPGKPRIKKNKFKRLACELCDLKFPTRELSNKHKREYHSSSWICEICGKTFVYQASHQNHIRTHFPPRLCCDLCDYRCSNKNDMGKHMRIHLGIKEYNCRLCSHTFTTVSNRLDHERRYHQKLKRFQCSFCDMAFYDKTKLNRHVDSHNSIKRFKCDVCSNFYTRRCHWKKHLEKQHNIIVPSQRPGRRRGGIPNKTLLDDVS